MANANSVGHTVMSWDCVVQPELLPQLLRAMDVKLMTGSEGQRKLTLGNATILAYCLRWPEFRVRFDCQPQRRDDQLVPAG